jgi:hypothetical protein
VEEWGVFKGGPEEPPEGGSCRHCGKSPLISERHPLAGVVFVEATKEFCDGQWFRGRICRLLAGSATSAWLQLLHAHRSAGANRMGGLPKVTSEESGSKWVPVVQCCFASGARV